MNGIQKRTWTGWVLLALALAGLAVSAVILSIHQKIVASGGQYTSFCNVNETVNCDVVLASSYADLFGLPVAVWALLTYAVLGAFAVTAMGASRFSTRMRMAQLSLALAAWSAAFSLYMAFIALFALHAVCLMCTSLYLINAGIIVTAWILYADTRLVRREKNISMAVWQRRSRILIATAAGVAILVLGIAGWEALARRSGVGTLEHLAQEDPNFYQWYTSQPIATVSPDEGNSKGSPNAPVTIVEFSDFQCEHCAVAYRVLKQVLPRYGGQVRVVYRNFPLDMSCNSSLHAPLHNEACEAAIAAECAGEQGRFWQYHDLLFENQVAISHENLLRFAQQLSLDVKAFQTCLKSDRARAKVERDVEEGVRLGIDSTPTMFLNGRTIKGSLNAQHLEAAIGIERAKRSS